MDTISRSAGKRNKTREPVRERGGTRRLDRDAQPPRISRFAAPACRAEASAQRREHQREGGFTPIVTAKVDIFFTISIPNFENTHDRPLPLNHLRKMPEETVKFRVDFARRAVLPRRSISAKAGSRHCHRRIAPLLHRFFTDFRFCFLLPLALQQLIFFLSKNGAIPGSVNLRSPTVTNGHLR
jgi:hypothetical protein